jgi:hypothetical protein
MSKDDLYDLILGASAVTIAYMLWKQHKQSTGQAGAAINVPAPVAIQGNEQTGYWYDLDQLTQGVF